MAPHGGAGTRKRLPPCVVAGCSLPRRDIRGATHCYGHHALKFAAGPPLQLAEFLANAEYGAVFKEWLGGARPQFLTLLEFWAAVNDYAAVSSRAVSRARAPLLYRRFLRPDTAGLRLVPLPDALREEIALALASDGACRGVFDAAHAIAYAQLQGLYLGEFRLSGQYREWAAENLGLTVPAVSTARASLLASAGISLAEVVAAVNLGAVGRVLVSVSDDPAARPPAVSFSDAGAQAEPAADGAAAAAAATTAAAVALGGSRHPHGIDFGGSDAAVGVSRGSGGAASGASGASSGPQPAARAPIGGAGVAAPVLGADVPAPAVAASAALGVRGSGVCGSASTDSCISSISSSRHDTEDLGEPRRAE
jgi:hypothetical protein